jgi:transcriptional regulator with XRE-family HTH domain
MPFSDTHRISALVVLARRAIGVSQTEFADLIGSSKRTIIRWGTGVTLPVEAELKVIARVVHPYDNALASEIASEAGETLASLGLESATPPSQPVEEASARPVPSPRDLVDSIVCAAAEAASCTPQAIRPALVAAFDRAERVGLDVAEVRAALREGRHRTSPHADGSPKIFSPKPSTSKAGPQPV